MSTENFNVTSTNFPTCINFENLMELLLILLAAFYKLNKLNTFSQTKCPIN